MKNDKQSGNALFLILIAVALFAALSYAVTQTGRGSGSINREAELLALSEYLQGVAQIESGVQRVRLAGCPVNQISFEPSPFDGTSPYFNAASPTDLSCHVFSPNGGGVSLPVAPANIFDPADAAPAKFYFFTRRNAIQDIGTTCTAADCMDLMVATEGVKRSVCISLNKLEGIDNPGGNPPEDTDYQGGAHFSGTFSPGQIQGDEPEGAVLAGNLSGCYREDDGTPTHVMYSVLIAR